MTMVPDSATMLTKGKSTLVRSREGTFTDNMKLPIHKWYRFSAGFSAEWVEEVIKSTGRSRVLDPFAGSGTTLLASDMANVGAVGFENHPFLFRIATAKLNWNTNTTQLRIAYQDLLNNSSQNPPAPSRTPNPLMDKCFTNDSLRRLDALKDTFLRDYNDGSANSELLWLGITSIIRACSHVGTAQWQYILPNKRKINVADPFDSFSNKMEQIINDIEKVKKLGRSMTGKIYLTDARSPSFPGNDDLFDLVITSPPYPNNYDYADATRLELTFWGEIEGWKDLQPYIRKHLIRSCSQHSAVERLDLSELLSEEILSPIIDELSDVCFELDKVRMTRGGRKTYHTMIAAYFLDLAKVFKAIKPLCSDGAIICFVIGDSAPYGVYVPADRWLGEIALSAGFKGYHFEKIRDRNIKWKNRVHNVPLHEGRLWIQG